MSSATSGCWPRRAWRGAMSVRGVARWAVCRLDGPAVLRQHPYADLSDFFYVWLRRNSARRVAGRMRDPADAEGGRTDRRSVPRRLKAQGAREHFETGMSRVFETVAARQCRRGFPATSSTPSRRRSDANGHPVDGMGNLSHRRARCRALRSPQRGRCARRCRGTMRAFGAEALRVVDRAGLPTRS